MTNNDSKGFLKIMIVLITLVLGIFGLATYYVYKNPAGIKNEYSILMNFEKLEVMKTVEERQLGLQNRKELCNKCGMLFLWEEPQVLDFWMLNTFVPIDIIYLDNNNIVKTIIRKPELNNAEKTYSSLVPVNKALEIPTLRTNELNIQVGTKLLFDY
jgi:uncharacterized membrane protein (UPF0127 family)